MVKLQTSAVDVNRRLTCVTPKVKVTSTHETDNFWLTQFEIKNFRMGVI